MKNILKILERDPTEEIIDNFTKEEIIKLEQLGYSFIDYGDKTRIYTPRVFRKFINEH